VLDIAREKGVSHFVLLSAICVQKPLLEFQRAKLKLEADLQVWGLWRTLFRDLNISNLTYQASRHASVVFAVSGSAGSTGSGGRGPGG
jgi:hypothetical protein